MEQNGEFGRWVYVYKCYFNDIVIKHQGLKRKFDVVFHKHHYYPKKTQLFSQLPSKCQHCTLHHCRCSIMMLFDSIIELNIIIVLFLIVVGEITS